MSSGIATGTKRGFPTTKLAASTKPSLRKGMISKRTKAVRSLIQEVVGLAPYEKRLLDMLKTGGASAEKRMYKLSKRRLGTHTRAQKKRDQIKELYGEMRAKAAMTA